MKTSPFQFGHSPAFSGPLRTALSILGLAGLYVVTGALGLMLSVPPGYATLIWPPSGLALGICLVHGRRLWPGVWIGSFLLNSFIAGAADLSHGLEWTKLAVAAAIAVGSTCQVLLACTLARRFVGLPLRLTSVTQICRLFILVGPIACVTAATVGVTTLWTAHLVSPGQLANNWLSWWGGDLFGVVVFLPLALIAPGNPSPIQLNGRGVGKISALTLFLLLIPLGLTFYAWKIVSVSEFKAKQDAFTALAGESENVLRHRLQSDRTALVSAAAYWHSQAEVNPKDWRTYVMASDIATNYPGLRGLGLIQPLPDTASPASTAALAGVAIHPVVPGTRHFVITRVEPMETNDKALGLDLAFEPNRMTALERATDTGRVSMTRKITLVQDKDKSPGFLLILPVYRTGPAPATLAERRASIKGWVYAPFVARDVFAGLTQSQDQQVNLQIFDQTVPTAAGLLYSSQTGGADGAFKVQHQFQFGQNTWVLVWSSTRAFDASERSFTPILILSAGLLFTAMLAILFFGMSLRGSDAAADGGPRERFLIPLSVFLVLALGAVFAYQTLSGQEDRYTEGLMERDAGKIEQLMSSRAQDDIRDLARYSLLARGATSASPFRVDGDASGFLRSIRGLRSLAVVGPMGAVDAGAIAGAAESHANTAAIEAALANATQRNQPVASPLVYGDNGLATFYIVIPMEAAGRPRSSLVAQFDAGTFAREDLTDDVRAQYDVAIGAGRTQVIVNQGTTTPVTTHILSRDVAIANQTWALHITPMRSFIDAQRSPFPIIALITGLVIALLCAFTVQALLSLNRQSRQLLATNRSLHAASTLNAAILASTRYIVITTDAQGVITSFNAHAERALGYAALEVVQKATPSIWHDPAELAAYTAGVNAQFGLALEPGFAALTKRTDQFGEERKEWTFIHKSGKGFPVRLVVTSLKGEAGETVGYLGISEDITDSRRQRDALVQSEERFRLAMENAPIGEALVGLDGRWLKVNMALCDLLGYSKSDLLATDFQTITHPEDLDADMALLDKVLAGDIPSYTLEKRYLHKDGRTIWGMLSVSLARKADGSPDHFISQIQDITERREMDRIKSEFITTVSHELKTPLTAIRGSLDFIGSEEAERLTSTGRRLVDMARRNCDKLVELISDIMDIDKIATGTLAFDIQPQRVDDLVEQCVAVNVPYAQKFDVTLQFVPQHPEARINVDSRRLQQALTNLLSNAAKFSHGQGTVTISVTSGDQVTISVRDQGTGIPAAFRGRILDRFAQADGSSTRAKGGSGLGLHITREIVERMGGAIGFDSIEGEGSTFWISFPAVTAEVANMDDHTHETR